MATTTPMQGLPVPEATDDPNIVDDMTSLALAIEKRLAGIYVSTADRDTKVVAGGGPIEGQLALCKDVNKLYAYFDTAWVQIYPPVVPAITSGSAAPDNSVGVNGDVYLRY